MGCARFLLVSAPGLHQELYKVKRWGNWDSVCVCVREFVLEVDKKRKVEQELFSLASEIWLHYIYRHKPLLGLIGLSVNICDENGVTNQSCAFIYCW